MARAVVRGMAKLKLKRQVAIENTNTGGKLLFFELPAGGAFQEGKTGLFGARDGQWRGKLR